MNPDVPDQLLNQFGQSKRPEDKPFTYIPTGGITELQLKQREVAVAPKVKPKPKNTARQGSNAVSETSQTSYDSNSLFTPAYLEMMKEQETLKQQSLPPAVPAEMVGYGPGKIAQDDVAAYILQPDGSMAALRSSNQTTNRWSDNPRQNLQNSAVMAALLEEQQAQMHGSTTGRIHNVSSSGKGKKQGLSFQVLQWLTGTTSEDESETTSNYSGSHDAVQQRQRHSTRESQDLQEAIQEEPEGTANHLVGDRSTKLSNFQRSSFKQLQQIESTDEHCAYSDF
ncbi:uncharacterized protein [Watersipora subatra]|uniref:uncharacterized protein isoform X2 n=1 Tax=Watersipora subatra TaxID=2589382 RepID=UPI00355BAEE3